MNFFYSIIKIGTRVKNENFLNEKIKTSNFIAVFFGALSIPFSIFTYYLIPEVAFIPPLFLILCMIAIFMNNVSFYDVSRFIISIGLMVTYSWYACLILPNNQPVISSFFVLQLLFLLPPWLVYDIHEKEKLIFCTLVTALVTFFIPSINNWFDLKVDANVIESFKDGWLANLLYFTSITGFSGGLFYMGYSNFLSEKNKDRLYKETQQNTLQLIENEKRTSEYLEQLKSANEEDIKRNWSSDGLAQFAQLLRFNDDNLKSTFDIFISKLIKYLNANQGGVFILNDKEELELISMYAYNRKKFLEKRIALGEGLIGQAVLEKDKIYLTNIPSDYINITSGLGTAAPGCVLIVPLMINEKVYGVIEIASFKKFENHQIDFVEKVGENLANTILHFNTTNLTKTLLEDFQQQTEKLKEQKEEINQNLEELQATQEELVRKEREHIKRINFLEEKLNTSDFTEV